MLVIKQVAGSKVSGLGSVPDPATSSISGCGIWIRPEPRSLSDAPVMTAWSGWMPSIAAYVVVLQVVCYNSAFALVRSRLLKTQHLTQLHRHCVMRLAKVLKEGERLRLFRSTRNSRRSLLVRGCARSRRHL